MAKYTMEQSNADKAAMAGARAELSRLVAGEGMGACSVFADDYLRIATYFFENSTPTPTSRRVYRMFNAIMKNEKISGFECRTYEVLLGEIEAKIKTLRKFFRKAKIKCFEPRSHRQPCYCARLSVVDTVRAVVASSMTEADKVELAARAAGALALERNEMSDA